MSFGGYSPSDRNIPKYFYYHVGPETISPENGFATSQKTPPTTHIRQTPALAATASLMGGDEVTMNGSQSESEETILEEYRRILRKKNLLFKEGNIHPTSISNNELYSDIQFSEIKEDSHQFVQQNKNLNPMDQFLDHKKEVKDKEYNQMFNNVDYRDHEHGDVEDTRNHDVHEFNKKQMTKSLKIMSEESVFSHDFHNLLYQKYDEDADLEELETDKHGDDKQSYESEMICIKVKDSAISNMYNNADFSDLIVKFSPSDLLHAHRIIIGAQSENLKNLISSPQDVEIDVAEMDEEEAELFRMIIKYMYTGYIECESSQVLLLLEMAEKYAVDELKNGIASFLSERLDKMVYEVFIASMIVNCCANLREKAILKIASIYEKTVQTYFFITLEKELLVELIKRDELNVKQEDMVLNSLLKWVAFDYDERKPHFKQLLSHIRFPYVTMSSFLIAIRKYPWFQDYLHEIPIINHHMFRQFDSMSIIELQNLSPSYCIPTNKISSPKPRHGYRLNALLNDS